MQIKETPAGDSGQLRTPAMRPRTRRSGPSLLPREHGVYAEVFFPLATALALGDVSASGVLLTASIVAAFLFHEPMLVLLGRRGSRARRHLARPARTRALITAVLALACGGAGMWGAVPDARLAVVALLPLGLILALLVARRRERTLFGESLVATALSFSSVPIGLTCGVPVSVSFAAASVWATVFLLGTTTVHAILARSKQGTVGLATGVAVGALLSIIGVSAMVSLGQPLGFLAVVPPALVCLSVIVCGIPPKRLRLVGWALVLANVATLAILLGTLTSIA